MRIVFEPSGTHIHKGFLKVRLDLYPDLADKTYALHHVQVIVFPEPDKPLGGYSGKIHQDEVGVWIPDNQVQYDKWLATLPLIWQLNPALCVFVLISEDTNLVEIVNYLNILATHATTIDDIMVQPNPAHLISPFMRDKVILKKEKITNQDEAKLISDINQRLAGISISYSGDGEVEPVEPGSIYIGAAATNRGASLGVYTLVNKGTPANATGSITNVGIWANSNLSNCEVATFFVVSGTNLTTRDNENIGSVTAGSEQIFTGLNIDVTATNCIGIYYSAGILDADNSGGLGIWYASGDRIPSTNYAFTAIANYVISLYGTGEEAGGGGWANIAKWRQGTGSITATDLAYICMGTGKIAVADIASINGVAV